MTEKSIDISPQDWLAIHTSITRLETKIDMVIGQHDERIGKNEKSITLLTTRVDSLESCRDKNTGKIAAIGIIFSVAISLISAANSLGMFK